MAYRPASDTEALTINTWLDTQHYYGLLRDIAWEILDKHARKENSPVYDIFVEQSAVIEASQGSANDQHDFSQLPLADGDTYNATEYLKTIDNPQMRALMAQFFNADGPLTVINAYDIYFGDVDNLSPSLRRERMDFLSRQERREEILSVALRNREIVDPNDLDEIKRYMHRIASQYSYSNKP